MEALNIDHARPGQSLNTQQAAGLFAKRRESSGPTRPAVSVEPPQAAEPDEGAGVLAEDVESQVADEALLESDSQEQTDEGEAEEAGPLALAEDQVVRLPDGTEMPVKELTRGLLREADYTQKTQAIAEQRKRLEQTTEVLSYHLGTMRQQAQAQLAQFQNIDWPGLFEKDPVEFQKTQLRHQQAQQQFQRQQAQEQEFLQRVEQHRNAERQARITEAVNVLSRSYPGGWSDGEYNSLIDYATSHGFSRQEVSQWDDAKVFLMLRKARAFDEAQKVGTKKIVQASPGKTLKSTHGVTAQTPAAKQTETKIVQQIKSAGSTAERTRLAAQLLASRRGAGRPR